MEQYTYFDIVKIRESLHFKMDAVKRGKELLAQKQVVLKSIDTGYINGYEETMGVIECEVKDREKGAGKRFKVHIIFSRDQAISAECSCSMFGGNFYRYYTQMDNCEHVAAALQNLHCRPACRQIPSAYVYFPPRTSAACRFPLGKPIPAPSRPQSYGR